MEDTVVREPIPSNEADAGREGDTTHSAPLDQVEAPDRFVGLVLEQRYEVRRPLARGGMGQVYVGHDRSLDVAVAVKFLALRDGSAPTLELEQRFEGEAKVLARLRDPRILRPLSWGRTPDGDLFMVTELLTGRPLDVVLREEGALDQVRTLRILLDVCRALAETHASGVLHRDLKPANLFVQRSRAGVETTMVLDFGIAKVVGQEGAPPTTPVPETTPGLVLGTVNYMSPEQARGRGATPASDLYSLGIAMYECLSGRTPFVGEVLSVMMAHVQTPPPPFSETAPERGIHEEVEGLVRWMLEKEPRSRPESAEVVAEIAEKLIAHLSPASPPSVVPSTPIERPAAEVEVAVPTSERSAAVMDVVVPLSEGPRAPERSARPLWLAATAAAAVVAWVGLDRRSAPSAAPPHAAPYIRHDENTVIGCPIFEASGPEVTGRAAWLGAAAAHATCYRLTYALGGDGARTRVPAELLGLPPAPTDDFPVAPFETEGARDRTVTAAKALGPRWIDGKIEVLPKTLGLELRIMAGETVLASSRGEGRSVGLAVRGALDALMADGAIARATQLLPSVAPWAGTSDVLAAFALIDADDAFTSGTNVDAAVGALDAHADKIRPEQIHLQRFNRDNIHGVANGSRPLPPFDETTVGGRFWSALVRGGIGTEAERKVAKDTFATIRKGLAADRADDRYARTMIGNNEAATLMALGEIDGARETMLRTVELNPRDAQWRLISWLASGTSWEHVGARAMAAWAPGDPASWIMEKTRDAPPTDQVQGYQRAVLLAPDVPVYSIDLARLLVMDGQPMRARSLAARMADGGPDAAFGAEVILASVEAGEAKFAKAAKRAQAALLGLERFGNGYDGSVTLSFIANDLAGILGTGPEWHDAFARRFVLAEPPRLVGQSMVPSYAAEACTQASPAVAKACFARLRALVAQGFFTEGRPGDLDVRFTIAERFALGDFKGVAEAHRPYLGTLYVGSAARAYDAIGDHDAARRVDELVLKWGALYGGANRAYVRAAKRAVVTKDYDAARKLAQAVIEAWGAADVPVPNVAEMKTLLASLPPRAD